VRERYRELVRIAGALNADEDEAGLPATRLPDAGFVHLAHAWAAGEPLADLLEDEELSGGDFVRNVRTLIDLLRGIGDVAPVPATAARARQAADALHRGVVSAASALEVPEDAPEGAGADPAG
jgi:ATP-dependent RNA helicase HelY